MQKKILYPFVFILMISSMFLIQSCEMDAEVDVPSVKQKIVIGAFLNPDIDTNFVTITLSAPIYDDSEIDIFEVISSALVVITDGTQTDTLQYNAVANAFVISSANFTLNYNTNYKIFAKVNDKESSANFRSIGNEELVILNPEIDSVVKEDEFGFYLKEFKIKVRWNDPVSETNFYRISVVELFVRETDTLRYYRSDIYHLMTDKNVNGTQLTYNFDYASSSNNSGLEITILKTDEDYYKYYKSLNNYVGDDPFSEATQVYTNVHNGLGIACSYKPSAKQLIF